MNDCPTTAEASQTVDDRQSDSKQSEIPNPKSEIKDHLDIRPLTLGWCLWLLGGWAVTLGIDSTVPAARWMVFSAAIGLLCIWPALRLSQAVHARLTGLQRSLGVLLDWLGLVLVLQAVIWPLQLSAGWHTAQTLWLNAALGSWGLLVGLWIAWARQFQTGAPRWGAMGAILAMLLAEPVLMLLTNTPTWMMRLSPLRTLWGLTSPPQTFVATPWVQHTVVVGGAAVIGWGVLLIVTQIGQWMEER